MGSHWLTFLILLSSVTVLAHQPDEGRVFATVGPYFYQTQSSYVHDPHNNPPGVGFGLLSEGDLSLSGGLEVGVFYVDKIFMRNLGSSRLIEESYKVSIPMGYRYWISTRFSAGLAFSASYSMGPYSTEYNDSNTMTDFTSAREGTEYDLTASVQWEAWTNQTCTIVLDGRYDYALSAKPNEDANLFGFLIGLKYLIHEKEIPPPPPTVVDPGPAIKTLPPALTP